MPEDAGTIIYHNPNCGTSRKVLAALREAGIEPKVVEYLKTPPSRDEFVALASRMGITPRQWLRKKEAVFKELNLDDPSKTDDALFDALAAHPILMERPVVVSPRGTKLCRPVEEVQTLIG